MIETIGYILLGLFMLFMPGFLLTLVFFPKPESLDFWERAAVSLGLGVLVLFYIGVVLARPDWKSLRLEPFTGMVLVVCGFFAVAAYLRKGHAVVAIFGRRVLRAIRKPRPPAPPPAQPPAQPTEEQLKPAHEQKAEGEGSVQA
jgi:uncharacterized membrane protein